MAFGFFKDLFDRFAGKPVDWDELEETLIRSDIGVPMTLRIIESLRQRGWRSRSLLPRLFEGIPPALQRPCQSQARVD